MRVIHQNPGLLNCITVSASSCFIKGHKLLLYLIIKPSLLSKDVWIQETKHISLETWHLHVSSHMCVEEGVPPVTPVTLCLTGIEHSTTKQKVRSQEGTDLAF